MLGNTHIFKSPNLLLPSVWELRRRRAPLYTLIFSSCHAADLRAKAYLSLKDVNKKNRASVVGPYYLAARLTNMANWRSPLYGRNTTQTPAATQVATNCRFARRNGGAAAVFWSNNTKILGPECMYSLIWVKTTKKLGRGTMFLGFFGLCPKIV